MSIRKLKFNLEHFYFSWFLTTSSCFYCSSFFGLHQYIGFMDLYFCLLFVFHLGVSLVYFPCTKVLLPLVLFIIISLSIEGCLNFVDRTV